jgi:hypothetical protein
MQAKIHLWSLNTEQQDAILIPGTETFKKKHVSKSLLAFLQVQEQDKNYKKGSGVAAPTCLHWIEPVYNLCLLLEGVLK